MALKLPILEAEILGLCHLLLEVRANRDELRQEIDDLRHDRTIGKSWRNRPDLKAWDNRPGFAAGLRQATSSTSLALYGRL
jgi:hypothetical protein